VYADNEQCLREVLEDVDVEREDSWVVFLRGRDGILRVDEEHVQSLLSLVGR
jgi:hypothetical protein